MVTLKGCLIAPSMHILNPEPKPLTDVPGLRSRFLAPKRCRASEVGIVVPLAQSDLSSGHKKTPGNLIF